MKTTYALAGDIALVTGSTSHIGKSIARTLAESGAEVIINGRNESAGDEAVLDIERAGGVAHFEQADLLDFTSVRAMTERVVKRFGRIDILVASGAGASRDSPPFQLFEEMVVEDFDRYIRAHWMSRAYAIHCVFPYMKANGGGRIVAICTDAGRVATVGESFIGGATSGMMQMCRVLAREFGRHNVRINSVALSYISDAEPRWGRGSEALEPDPDKRRAGMLESLRKRMLFDVKQEDIAGAVAYLVSPAADAVTGQTLSVNGGLSTF